MRKYISETTKAYIAGFFDGEGSVGLYEMKSRKGKGGSYGLQVTINNVNPLPLKLIQEIFDGRLNIIEYQKENFPIKRTVWQWRINAKKAEFFLSQILDYVIIKKEEILLALEYRKTLLKCGKQKHREMITDELYIKRKKMAQKMKELKCREWIM